MIKVRALKGARSVHAYCVFAQIKEFLIAQQSMLGQSREETLKKLEALTEEEVREEIKRALTSFSLDEDNMESLYCFAEDSNGVPYGSANIGNLGPAEIIDIMAEVCVHLNRIHVYSITDEEKKNLKMEV